MAEGLPKILCLKAHQLNGREPRLETDKLKTSFKNLVKNVRKPLPCLKSKRHGQTRVTKIMTPRSHPGFKSKTPKSASRLKFKTQGSTPAFQKQDYDAYLHKGPTWQIPSTKMPSKRVQRTTPLRQGINSSRIRVEIQSIPKIRPSQPRTFKNFGGGSVGCLKITIDSWPLSDFNQQSWLRRLQSDDFHVNKGRLQLEDSHVD